MDRNEKSNSEWASATLAALLATLIKRAADVEPWLKEAEDLLWTPL